MQKNTETLQNHQMLPLATSLQDMPPRVLEIKTIEDRIKELKSEFAEKNAKTIIKKYVSDFFETVKELPSDQRSQQLKEFRSILKEFLG